MARSSASSPATSAGAPGEAPARTRVFAKSASYKTLTEELIAGARAGEGRVTIRCKSTGLELRLNAEGGRSWSWRPMRQGERRRIAISERGEKTLTLAEAKARVAKIDAALDAGGERARMATAGDTVADLVESYRKLELPKLGTSRNTEAERLLRRWVLPEIGARRVRSIATRDLVILLEKAHASATSRGQPGITANRLGKVLSPLFTFAQRHGWVDTSPAIKLPTLVNERPREVTPTAEQLAALWRLSDPEAPVGMTRQMACVFRIILLTGSRVGAVVMAEKQELHLDADGGPVWIVPGAEGRKAKTPRTVPLGVMATGTWRQALDLAPPKHPHVFPGQGLKTRHLSVESVAHAMRRLAEDHPQLGGWTPHDIRRAARTALAKARVRPDTAERFLGHVVGSAVQRIYDQHDYGDELREAAATWEASLLAMVTPAGPPDAAGAEVVQLAGRRKRAA